MSIYDHTAIFLVKNIIQSAYIFRIVITLCDESLQRRPMQFVLRNVEKVVRFNYKENGSYGPASEDSNPPGGFVFENNDIYTLTVVVTDTHFQVWNFDISN